MTTTTQASTENATSNAPRACPEERRNFCTFNPVGVAALVAPKGRPRVRAAGVQAFRQDTWTWRIVPVHRQGLMSGSSWLFSSE